MMVSDTEDLYPAVTEKAQQSPPNEGTLYKGSTYNEDLVQGATVSIPWHASASTSRDVASKFTHPDGPAPVMLSFPPGTVRSFDAHAEVGDKLPDNEWQREHIVQGGRYRFREAAPISEGVRHLEVTERLPDNDPPTKQLQFDLGEYFAGGYH